MKCPQCIESGLRSTISIGGSFTTSMASASYYDEGGNYHHHDLNMTSTTYRCSNGHEWTGNSKSQCPNLECDFGRRTEEVREAE